MINTVYVNGDNDIVTIQIPAINNTGPTAHNVVVQITYGAGLQFVNKALVSGTYNQTTKRWTIGNLPGNSVYILGLQLKVLESDDLPLEVTWQISSDNPDVSACNDNCGKYIIALAPESTAGSCQVYEFGGNVLCGGILECGVCSKEFEIVPGSEDNLIIDYFNPETGVWGGHKPLISEPGSFQWTGNCVDCPDTADIVFGPHTVSVPGVGQTSDMQFCITFDGLAGKGAVGSLTIDVPDIPENYYIEESIIDVVTPMVGGGHITLGIDVDDPDAALNSTTGLVATLNAAGISKNAGAPSKATIQRAIVAEVWDVAITEGVICAVLRITKFTPNPSPSNTPSKTPTPSITPSKTVTPSITASPVTPTPTPTVTASPVTPTPTPTPTVTSSVTPSETVTPSVSSSVTITPSETVTPSETPTVTPTNSLTPSETVTPSNSLTPSETATPSVTQSTSITPSETVTPTTTVSPSSI